MAWLDYKWWCNIKKWTAFCQYFRPLFIIQNHFISICLSWLTRTRRRKSLPNLKIALWAVNNFVVMLASHTAELRGRQAGHEE